MPRNKPLQAVPPVPTIGPPATSAEVPSGALPPPQPDPVSAKLPSTAETQPENPLGEILLCQTNHAEEFGKLMRQGRPTP